jgi:bidirectional [NiFe] hydrogenase diaphorase subunit
MHGLLTKIVDRRASSQDLDMLVRLCHMVRDTSLCGLGQTAPNPVLSTLKYFRDEYDARLSPGPRAGGGSAWPS